MTKAFAPKQGLRRVKVRFCIEENQVRTFEVPEDILNKDLWYTVIEHETIKSQSRIDARDWRKMGYSTLLKDVFEDAGQDAENYIYIFCSLEGICINAA